MKGQWIGDFQGSHLKGRVTVDVDELPSGFRGRIAVFGDPTSVPPLVGFFETTSKQNPARFSVSVAAAHPQTTALVTWDEVSKLYPNGQFARSVQVSAAWSDKELKLDWTSDLGGQGQAILPASVAGATSEYPANAISWEDFKIVVMGLEPRRFVFRGQRKPRRLRTTFHRTGRSDLTGYTMYDIPALHQHISGRTRHLFALANGAEYGAFLHLAQHHGYPTPLLDWSYSPFVATFFAYRSTRNSEVTNASEDDRVRIFKFDKHAWQKTFANESNVDALRLHLSFFEFLAVDNERMIPQQALSSVTNIDDIETYIRMREQQNNCNYLEVFDLQTKDRRSIMRELSMMGITAGSLFPGLDGSCEELKERFFDE
ncbi:FRG domain-containing protein [Burkholderia sp. Ac-20365]|uniref:FRG domain-containing protein n=1 Tax=Burkholderia sp. Ac-20365 TaxID=2703897 RepID=UPI00197CAFDE|nr:FRG domain-containing protein [Burkholderia sp. Ac-20365]MBN3762026.1 FRG domain-containing protein [Burkholderia sp. Ac-20365]